MTTTGWVVTARSDGTLTQVVGLESDELTHGEVIQDEPAGSGVSRSRPSRPSAWP
jgi:hypothetical protein